MSNHAVDSPLRPIHYLGNKSRYLTQIAETIDSLVPHGAPVADLFAGTGIVSRALADSHPVFPVDIQAYSATLAKALCSPVAYSADERRAIVEAARDWIDSLPAPVEGLVRVESELMDIAVQDPLGFILLTEEGSLSSDNATDQHLSEAKAAARPHLASAGATTTAYYGGVYFSYRQALEIDAIRHAIGHRVGSHAEPTLVAALLGVASDLVATVGGHFAQPMRLRGRTDEPKRAAIAKSLKFRRQSAFRVYDEWLSRYSTITPSKYPCTPATEDFRTALGRQRPPVAGIYADPPYTRDHYSRFYHVLETIALADDPGVAVAPGTSLPSRGIYRLKRHQSPFSIRSQVVDAFDALFTLGQRLSVPLVLSYSPQGGGTRARPETRLMSIDQLTSQARSRYPNVEVVPIDSSTHSRFNRTELHGTVPIEAEVLLIARP
ncbi:DNA adenine methylase [Microbacterium testaceum]|uniref:DNA adenine methylase n=1 Tax=Microbacterium testaceum TaxID=2033 RepID=UPI003437487D